ncbi:hypothetical protein Acr_24g0009180 [Actinidia rufa]|uniref:Retrotransposon gag domain-containing protein n=1 Tax=Actinidia rufa TaxID=165716 RepID=A0A7J0GVC9_9ERIC|nr:hypothetical protein Acr_24g0009180 [Actinidia rufa]
MANTIQAPDLEGIIHCEMHGITEQIRVMNEINARLVQHLATSNPPPPVANILEEIDRSCRFHRTGDHDSHSHYSVSQRNLARSHPLYSASLQSKRGRDLDVSESRSSSRILDTMSEETRRHRRSPRGIDRAPSANALIAVDALIKQTKPPFIDKVMRVRVSSRFKLPSQLRVYEGKIVPMDHLDSYKNLMSLQGYSNEALCCQFHELYGQIKSASHLFIVHQKDGDSLKDYVKCFNQTVLEVEDLNDKVMVMAMMEGLRPGPLFDFLSKNVPETLSTL